MELTPRQAEVLRQLTEGKELPQSVLPLPLRDRLLHGGAISRRRSGRGFLLRAHNPTLYDFLSLHYGVKDLQQLAGLGNAAERTRSAVARAATDTKALKSSPFQGIYLRTLGDSVVQLAGEETQTPAGSALLVPITKLDSLRITPNRMVGVENVEAFLNIEKMGLPTPGHYVAVLRWQWGQYWKQWVAANAPELDYAGDYDLAGIHIFQSEVLPIHPRARFLLSEHVHKLIESRGSRTLFQNQERRYKNLHSKDPEIMHLIQCLRRFRKCLEQEVLIQ